MAKGVPAGHKETPRKKGSVPDNYIKGFWFLTRTLLLREQDSNLQPCG